MQRICRASATTRAATGSAHWATLASCRTYRSESSAPFVSKWATSKAATSTGSSLVEKIRSLPRKPPSSSSSSSSRPRRSDYSHDRPSPPSHSPSRFSTERDPPPYPKNIPSVPAHILAHRSAMKARFPSGWNPPKKLSREAMDGVRTLHEHDPETFTSAALAERFKISPEAVRRILKSRWQPDAKRMAEMAARESEARKAMIMRTKAGAGRIVATPTRTAREDEDLPKEEELPADTIPSLYMDEASDRSFGRGGR